MMAARLVVLSGPSGVGKSTVISALRAKKPELWVSVSATTRPPRHGETNGVQYHFLSDAEFDHWIEEGRFLEWATFAGYRYGTPREPVLTRITSGESVLIEIELQGARQVRSSMPEALLVFLSPPSWEELERRLIGRGTESETTMAARLAAARDELAAASEFDLVIVNSSVEEVIERLVALAP
jgi:guanylate kinase